MIEKMCWHLKRGTLGQGGTEEKNSFGCFASCDVSDDVYDDDDGDDGVGVDVDDVYVNVDGIDHDDDVVVDDGDYDGDDRMPIALIKKLDRGRDSVAGGDG